MSLRFLSIVILAVLVVGCAAKPPVNSNAPDPTHIISNAMITRDIGFTGPTEGFKQAIEPYKISLPRDLGTHPEYKLEWWYYNGNLQDSDGKQYSYHFTIFRQALVPPRPPTPGQSAWRTNEGYLGDFTLTDASGQVHRHAYRWARGGEIGLAGVQAEPYRAWVESWSASGDEKVVKLSASDDVEKIGIDLELKSLKPFVAQGDNGLSQKGSHPGEASYYFSLTRMETTGNISIDGKTIPVRGLSWMDREWGTNMITGQVGWDWFALQGNNGAELMWYQIRYPDGKVGPNSQGSIIDSSGGKTELKLTDVQIKILERWKSNVTGISYPAHWKITVPSKGIDIDVKPLISAQEVAVGHRYWEGAVEFAGIMYGENVSGRGFVELTGYDVEQRSK